MAAKADGLVRLAQAYGVVTEYRDWQGRPARVPESTLRAVLTALGADVTDPERALTAHRLAPWTRMLPPVLVLREGEEASVAAHHSPGKTLRLQLQPEDGSAPVDLHPVPGAARTEHVGAGLIEELRFAIPDDLPSGYHTVHAEGPEARAQMRLIVTPRRLGRPEGLAAGGGWGIAAQLYSLRSRGSWHLGDLSDLNELCIWAAVQHGADFVLVNPMHAPAPVTPMPASPYLPASRRFSNPIYLRPEALPEYALAGPELRSRVHRLHEQLETQLQDAELIERDPVWRAKLDALDQLRAVPRSPGRELSYRWFLRAQGRSLEDWARWCAIAEEHGADWRSWPQQLQDPGSAAVEAFAQEHADRVELHRWLQWLTAEQLLAANDAARHHGMAVGVIHDLAVGVDPAGADAWRMQDVYAQGMSVGAPPDAYSQTGQDWGQPPWRPDALAAAAYEPFRQLVASALASAGGLRIDHIAGLFRLWWIPEGGSAAEGAYVRYDHEALIGILCLEAERAGAVIIGEDVGTVEQSTRDYLRERGVLGTSILWFERDWEGDRQPLEPARWREACMASVSTHDLPPAAGYLRGDHLRLRAELGMLTRPLEQERAEFEAERALWVAALRRQGLLHDAPGSGAAEDEDEEQDVIAALHRYLARTPAVLRSLSLTDAVGDRRTQNQPGTDQEYPNWRVPLSGPDGKRLLLEDVFRDPRVAALIAELRDPRP